MIRMMKLIAPAAIIALLTGCATSSYETRYDPPSEVNQVFMRYKELPGQKVMVIAVDPTGQWAFGYDHSRATLEEAAATAAKKCDIARQKFEVFSKAKLYAINDEVVYYKHLNDAQ